MIGRKSRIFALLALTLIVWPALLQAFPGCVEYPDFAHWVLRYDPDLCSIHDMASEGDLIAATRLNTLYMLELSDASSIELLGETYLSEGSSGITMQDGHVYTKGGSYPCQLYSYDVTNPAAPVVLDSFNIYNQCYDMYQDGDYLYCTTGDSLKTFDISTPGLPGEVANGYMPGFYCDILVDGDYLYTISGMGDFVIWNISDPALPVLLGEVPDLWIMEYTLTKQGDYIYIVISIENPEEALILTIDVTDPFLPEQVGSWTPSGYWEQVEIENSYSQGDYLFVGLEWDDEAVMRYGMLIFDISDPPNPIHQNSLEMYSPMEFMAESASPGIFHVSAGGGGYWLLDMSNPEFAAITGSHTNGIDCIGIDVVGNLAYVTTENGYLRLYDLADSANPAIINSFFLDGGIINSVFVDGDRAYLAHMTSGIDVVDIGDPHEFTLLGSFATDMACDIVVSGTRAYVADYSSGLRVFNVSDPGNISEIGSYDTPGEAYSLELQGNVAYVADKLSGLCILNVANPGYITELSTLETPSRCIDVTLQGNYAFMACSRNGLCIADISNPSAPVLLPYRGPTAPYSRAIGVRNNYAYLVHDFFNVTVYDIHDPTDPLCVGLLPLNAAWAASWARRGIDFSDDGLLVLAMGDMGIVTAGRQCDITPVMLSSFIAEASAGRVDLNWELAQESDLPSMRLGARGEAGEWDVDFHETAPRIFAASDDSDHLAAGGEVVYTLWAMIDEGWIPLRSESVDLAAAAPVTLLHAAWPNPFNPRTMLAFDLAVDGPARLCIYDVGGRLLRELAAGEFEAGRHEFVWGGRDEHGNEAASGVYFARLEAAGTRQARRLIMLR